MEGTGTAAVEMESIQRSKVVGVSADWLGGRGLGLLLLAFLAARVFLPSVLKPVGYVADWNDYYFFESWAKLSDRGLYPYLDFWMEHPPLFPWLVVLAYRLSAAIPAWHDPHLAFSLVLGSMLLLFETGNLLLIVRIAGRVGGASAGIAAGWIYALLFAPVFYWSAGFECYPLFFLLAGTELSLAALGSRRPGMLAALAGSVIGIGIMVKLIPGLVLAPAAFALLRTGRRSGAMILVVAAVITAGAIAAPFALANPAMARASMTSLLSRPGWETVWALADGYYSGGAVAKPETRLDPATAASVDHESKVPMLPVLAAFAGLGAFVLWRTRRWSEPATLVAAVGLTLNLFLLASKGFSPQFLVYVLAPLVVLWPNGRGITYALLFSLVNLVEYPLALLLFADQPAVLVAAVLARTTLLAVLSYEYLTLLTGWKLPRPAKAFGIVAGGALVTCLLIVVGRATAGYAASAAANDSTAPAVAVLRSRPGSLAVFSDRGLFDRMTPLLRGSVDTRLALPGLAPRIPPVAEAWDVYIDSDEGRRLTPLVAKSLAGGYPAESLVVTGLRLTLYGLTAEPGVERRGGDFGLARLKAAWAPASNRSGGIVPVLLVWESLGPLPELKVFVHLTDSAGQPVAQRDSVPANGARPTSGWRLGEQIVDREGVAIAADLPPGDYGLRTGLYDPQSGRRLSGIGSDSLDLGTIRVDR